MFSWIIWAVMLVAQSGSTTWASRARNSGSVLYHGVASAASNGVWFLNFLIGVNKAQNMSGPWEIVGTAVFYTAFTVAGACFMHWFSMTHLEKGKRRVGVA